MAVREKEVHETIKMHIIHGVFKKKGIRIVHAVL